MSAVRNCFAKCKAEGRSALVVYLTEGDPSPKATVSLMASLADNGADIIELGVPFSDPSADGPVIQEAMQRALAAGAGLKSALATVREFRKRGHKTPVVLFGYYNPIFVYGLARFAADAAAAGIDALLTVDLPIDELEELSIPLRQQGVEVVPLLAPTSTASRIARVKAFQPAFVYYVSMTGVTGSAFRGSSGGAERVAMIQDACDAPVAVGFGIKTPDDAAKVAQYADGVVVGSALVKRIGAAKDLDSACESIGELTAALRGAMN